MSRGAISAIVFIVAAILMVIRVDWWWWGDKVEPLVFGWLSYPVLYQLVIWAAGYALVIIVARYLWADPKE